MSSRVQKGNTIFRPVAKLRSRAPTANPAQTSLLPSASEPPSFQDALPAALPPIPSTAVPARETARQVPFSRPESIPIAQQILAREFPTPTRGVSIPPVVTSQNASVLANVPNPPLITIGRFATEQANVVSVSSHQEYRPPTTVSHTLQFSPTTMPIIAGPSQQNTFFLAPSGPPPIEVTNNLPPGAHIPQNSALPPMSPKKQDGIGEKSRRKRRLSNANSDGETEEGPAAKRHRSRSTSLPPYDPHAHPGEDIDPTVVTMAALCSDTGQGRVSSKAAEILNNHAAWKVKGRERRARMKAVMEAKKYGRSVDEESDRPGNPPNPTPEGENRSHNPANSPTGPSPAAGDDESGFDYTQQMETSRYNVQVRIGPNGETIIDEDSLVVDRAENEDTSAYTHVVESDHTKFVNSGSYGKRYRGSRWSAEETELFYHALSQYGENYELIAYVLPGRDRKSCKNKFKAEDKKNHARINYCLNNRIPVDMKTLERMTGKDFSGPTPEIRAPPPPPIVQSQPTEDTTSNTDPQADPVRQPTKRSRSKTGLEDGVVIIGDVDNVLP